MSSNETTFKVGEYAFELAPLKVKSAMKGWGIVGSVLLPIFAGEGTFSLQGISGALAGIDRIGELFDLFADVAKVQWQANGMVSVKTFADNVFGRRSDLILGFLAECVLAEYGSFLDETGKAVLSTAGSRFASLLA